MLNFPSEVPFLNFIHYLHSNPLIPNNSELLKQKFQFMSKIFCSFAFVKTKYGDGLIE